MAEKNAKRNGIGMILTLILLYATYTKQNPETGFIYVGRTSGWVKMVEFITAQKIVKRRDQNHHKSKDGYDDAVLDKYSIDPNAIRGREQEGIEKNRAKGISGNKRNGISPRNKKRLIYMSAALAAFTETTGWYYIFPYLMVLANSHL